MAVESIAKTLGAGSGIDVAALVNSLVEAQFAPKKEALAKREEALEAQISGVSKLREAITGFDKALKQLARGGTLTSKVASSNEGAVRASFQTGTAPSDVTAQVGVKQLASAQVTATDTIYAPGAAFRTGTLTLRMGRDVVDAGGNVTGFTEAGAVDIAIGGGDATLAGIAAKINAAAAGVTAKVITDGAGERLVMTGASGAANSFRIDAAEDSPASGESLAGLAVGPSAAATTTGTRARDAVVTVDGVQYIRTTNSVGDLIPGVKLDLTAVTISPVSLTTTKPTAALLEAVNNFVETYNEVLAMVREEDDSITGALRGDTAVDALARDLRGLTTRSLVPAGAAGAPRMLADLGVATGRDGSLSVDQARLAKAIAEHPEQVERMLAEGAGTGEAGLPQALGAITTRMTSKLYGLDKSASVYSGKKQDLADAKAKAAEAEAAFKERLTKQYAAMDARASAYKATMTFMDNQIKAWNRSDA